MQTLIIVRDVNGAVPYWASGTTLKEARANYKKYSRKFPSSKASIVALTGEEAELDKVLIDDMGTISYPKTVTKTTVQ